MQPVLVSLAFQQESDDLADSHRPRERECHLQTLATFPRCAVRPVDDMNPRVLLVLIELLGVQLDRVVVAELEK